MSNLNQHKSLRRLVLYSGTTIFMLLAIWLVFGNLLALLQEKPLEKAWTELTKKYPLTKDNASAQELERLRSQLGLSSLLITKERENLFPPTEEDQRIFQEIDLLLKNHIRFWDRADNDKVYALDTEVRIYFQKKRANIDAIRNYILENELPQWETYDITRYRKNSHNDGELSFYNLINLQNILLTDALEKNRLGQYTEAFDSLQAAWKLYQSISQRPDLVSQWDVLKSFGNQITVIKKMDRLPPDWQQKLNFPNNLRQSTLVASELENLSNAAIFKDSPVSAHPEKTDQYEPPINARILYFFSQPYWRLAAVDSFVAVSRFNQTIAKENICTLDVDKFSNAREFRLSGWNNHGYKGLITSDYWKQVIKQEMDSELTQKIQQIKAEAVKIGQPPRSIPGLEKSAACPGMIWDYQVNENGVMSIKPKSTPPGLKSADFRLLSLKYRLQMSDLQPEKE